ncbi:MAG: VOC family protein [Ferruginibacter sp.]
MKEDSTATKGLQSITIYGFAFTVKDLDHSVKWYQDILGFNKESQEIFDINGKKAKIAFMELAAIKLELMQIDGGYRIEAIFADPPDHLLPIGNKTLVLQVPDLHLATRELEEKKVKFEWKEMDLSGNGIRNTMIRDIDGNFISIFQKNMR